MSVETMQALLIDELKDLYSATASDSQPSGIAHKGQDIRLEQIGELVGKKLAGKTCVGMKGILEEGPEVLEDTDKGTLRDGSDRCCSAGRTL